MTNCSALRRAALRGAALRGTERATPCSAALHNAKDIYVSHYYYTELYDRLSIKVTQDTVTGESCIDSIRCRPACVYEDMMSLRTPCHRSSTPMCVRHLHQLNTATRPRHTAHLLMTSSLVPMTSLSGHVEQPGSLLQNTKSSHSAALLR